MSDLARKELANRIREKVRELNDDLIKASDFELDVEFTINKTAATQLVVWCTQEV